MGGCIVRVSQRNLFYLYLTDSGRETVASRTVLPDPSPEVADLGQEAELLQGPVYLLLIGVEEVHSDAPGVKSGNQPQVLKALNDTFLSGFWLAGE